MKCVYQNLITFEIRYHIYSSNHCCNRIDTIQNMCLKSRKPQLSHNCFSRHSNCHLSRLKTTLFDHMKEKHEIHNTKIVHITNALSETMRIGFNEMVRFDNCYIFKTHAVEPGLSLSLHYSAWALSSTPTTFSFPSFNSKSCRNGSLICMGSVTAGDGYLSITPDLQIKPGWPGSIFPPRACMASQYLNHFHC